MNYTDLTQREIERRVLQKSIASTRQQIMRYDEAIAKLVAIRDQQVELVGRYVEQLERLQP
jgi:hypothetical protein